MKRVLKRKVHNGEIPWIAEHFSTTLPKRGVTRFCQLSKHTMIINTDRSLPLIVAVILLENDASIGLAQKLGMRHGKEIVWRGGPRAVDSNYFDE